MKDPWKSTAREKPAPASACSSALVSLIILTCNRPQFLRLALESAAAQTYDNLEAIVVDDGSERLTARSFKGWRMPVHVVRLSTRLSIGEKRNAGVAKARGQVFLHWDDDDMHDPRQVAALACPILRNDTDVTSLTFSYLAMLDSSAMRFFDYAKGAKSRASTGPFLGSLAYSRAVATSLSLASPGSPIGLFARVSLSEDLHFVERALSSCFRMLPISRIPIVYVRHAAVHNTWQPNDFHLRMATAHEAQPPMFVEARMIRAYVAAEKQAASLGACVAKQRHEPSGLHRPLRFPYMPQSCCKRGPLRTLRRPCTDSISGADDCGDETFCGGVKGTCTATCTCAGEQAHLAQSAVACGTSCCAYWHRFWRRHPGNCTLPRPRPLKTHYCGAHRQGPRRRISRGSGSRGAEEPGI